MARVELDLPALYQDLAAEKIFRSQNIIDRPSNILHDRLTEFRLIDDGSFMVLVDITIARNYTLRLASQNYVLLVFYLAGQLVLPWERGNRAPAGPGASVTVLWDSGRPWDYPRTMGQAYKRLSIFVDAAKLVDQYGLKVDNLPAVWNGIFSGRPNARAANPLSLSPRAWLALDAVYRCQMEEPLRTHYIRAKGEELICETVVQLNQIGRAGKSSVLAKATKERQLIETAALIYQSDLHDQPDLEEPGPAPWPQPQQAQRWVSGDVRHGSRRICATRAAGLGPRAGSRTNAFHWRDRHRHRIFKPLLVHTGLYPAIGRPPSREE